MRASIDLLRHLFIAIGVIECILGGLGLMFCLIMSAFSPYAPVLAFFVLAGMLLSLNYINCGINLPSLLESNLRFVQDILYVRLALTILATLIMLGFRLFLPFSLVPVSLSLLCSVYLIYGVKLISR